MRKYQAIIDRVEQYEQKRGIAYLKSNGKFFNFIKSCFIIVFAYSSIINLLAVLSWALRINNDTFGAIANAFYTTLVCLIINVAGFVLVFTKVKLYGIIIQILPTVFSLITYAPLLEDATQKFGYKLIFFTRHLIPSVIIIILLLIMFFVIIFEKVKYLKSYRKVETIVYAEYEEYRKNNDDISWEDYLKGL